MVQQVPAPVVTNYVAVPQLRVERYRKVTLAADIFFVDMSAFLITLSRRIKFITAEHVSI